MGRARGEEAWNHELRGGYGLQDTDKRGETAGTVVVSPSQLQHQRIKWDGGVVDYSGTKQS